ncbi:MAG: hypothetical protein IPL61_27415 [Myxococcales bacterium]|nr:hypothetical protein [Myxococcales bacterium]
MSADLAAATVPDTGVVLRHQVLAWPEPDGVGCWLDGTRVRLPVEWPLDRVELTSDARWLAAWGDQGRRIRVWRTDGMTPALDLVGADRRHSLSGGLATLGDRAYGFVARRDGKLEIHDLIDGRPCGWLSITGWTWFHVHRVASLAGRWLAVRGHGDGEQYDTVVVVPGDHALAEDQAIQMALTQGPGLREWGYQLAAGPVGASQVAIFRDPEWEPDDDPDPSEAFRGVAVHDPRDGSVVRIPLQLTLAGDLTIGGDGQRIVLAHAGQVDIVSRASGDVIRRPALALDPERLEIARRDGDRITVEAL